MATVTANEVEEIVLKSGFKILNKSSYEEEENSASQRLRYSFMLWYRGLYIECLLRHNLEGHNNNPNNTHRLHVCLGSGFTKNFDFWGQDKENGPSAEVLGEFFAKFVKILDGLCDLR